MVNFDEKRKEYGLNHKNLRFEDFVRIGDELKNLNEQLVDYICDQSKYHRKNSSKMKHVDKAMKELTRLRYYLDDFMFIDYPKELELFKSQTFPCAPTHIFYGQEHFALINGKWSYFSTRNLQNKRIIGLSADGYKFRFTPLIGQHYCFFLRIDREKWLVHATEKIGREEWTSDVRLDDITHIADLFKNKGIKPTLSKRVNPDLMDIRRTYVMLDDRKISFDLWMPIDIDVDDIPTNAEFLKEFTEEIAKNV